MADTVVTSENEGSPPGKVVKKVASPFLDVAELPGIGASSDVVKRKIKFKLSDLEESLPAVKWGKDRPRPQFTHDIWEDEVVEELEKYADWHKRHPHCVTPRKLEDTEGHVVGRKVIDKELPGRFYTDNGVKVVPLPKDFLPTELGLDGEWDEVSTIAMKTEFKQYIKHGLEDDDPWFIMSVKDHLEQSHIDGTHTTVKTKVKQKAAMSEFDKEAAWQKLHYGDYQGGFPTLSSQHKSLLDKLALSDKSVVFDAKPKKKISPWADTHVFSKYTANGTALQEFNKRDLQAKIQYALDKHYHPEATTESSSNKPNRKGKKKSRKAKASVKIDPIEEMRDKLGGEDNLKKLETNLVKYAKVVTKKAKVSKTVVDTSVNLFEACEKLRVLKVLTLLMSGKAFAEMNTPEDESLLLYSFHRIIKMDVISNCLLPSDAKRDSSDRKKLQKILDVLLKYGADINSTKSKDGTAAVHIAAGADDVRMIDWLFKNKAEIYQLTPTVDMLTPLMVAAKFGNVQTIAKLVECGYNLNHQNPLGKTALHVAAATGQTRTALFLMRIGADKMVQDKDRKTPAALAEANNFQATAQAIAAHTNPIHSYKDQLQFTVDQYFKQKEKEEKQKAANNTLFSSLFSGSMADASRALLDSTASIGKIATALFSRITKKFHKIFPSDDDEEDEGDIDLDRVEELAQQLILKEQKDNNLFGAISEMSEKLISEPNDNELVIPEGGGVPEDPVEEMDEVDRTDDVVPFLEEAKA